jgi:hypothetical protein
MIPFDLDLFTNCWATIAHLREHMAASDDECFIDKDQVPQITKDLIAFCRLLGSMDLRMSKISVEKIVFEMNDHRGDPKYLQALLTEFIIRFREESEATSAFIVEPKKVEFYEDKEPIFGPAVNEQFSSAAYDIAEAGKCYALERSTACVLHLMRVLEIGLAAMASDLNVDFEHRNWENIINEIEKAIKAFSSRGTKPPNWKQSEQFYAELAKDFRYLKNAWRNHAMHAREKYTPEEAGRILDYIKSFMQTLAAGGLGQKDAVPNNINATETSV